MLRALACAVLLITVLGVSFGAPARWWKPVSTAGGVAADSALGADARPAWTVTPATPDAFSTATDALLGRPVLICGKAPLILQSKAACQNAEITALVRVVTNETQRNSSCELRLRDPADLAKPGMAVSLSGAFDGDLSINAAGVPQAYNLRAYDTIMPTWPALVREPIEKDMGNLPLAQDKWVRVRCLLSDGRLRIWVDDRLIVDKTRDFQAKAIVQFTLQPEGRLAELTVRPLAKTTPVYESVALDGYVRDRAVRGSAAVADAALPFGQTVNVNGIPIRFVDRKGKDADHLDIGHSLCRQGSLEGYFPTYDVRYAGSWTVDPARIQLRVPNGRYDAMYVVAGYNGESNSVPILSAMFYRPGAGFNMCFEGTIPGMTAQAAKNARPLGVVLDNGKRVNLWLVKIPLDPAKLSSFSDLDVVEVELTKKVHQYRSYPDPYLYGWHGAGLPSGVQVYAVTLHRPEVELALDPTAFGHVWTAPGVPSYTVTLTNSGTQKKTVQVIADAISYDRGEKSSQQKAVVIEPGQTVKTDFSFPVTKNGIHTLAMTLKDGAQRWTETRNFCRLATDTRAPYWKDGDGPMFGVWTYGSGHYGPPTLEVYKEMRAAGARGSIVSKPDPNTPEGKFVIDSKWALSGNAWPLSPQWDWAGAQPLDMAKYNAYKETALKAFRDVQGDNPEFVTFFPEPHISRDLTAGPCPPDYYGEEYKLTPEEENSLRVFFNTSKSAAESIRAAWPNTKILIPWGDPLFPVALLRAGFPKELTNGNGLDMIGFERLPEQQLAQMSTHRLYVLKEEYRRAGVQNPQMYYIEGTFSPTEPGALTWDEQAERYHRWTLISLAYGIERFYSGWFAFDCGSYYGAEHYGGCGIQRRIPYLDPKPAYAHYATMTRHLERSKFDRWLPTGSNTVYALKFQRLGQPVYALWAVRGTRPVTLTLANDATFTLTDSMDNGIAVKTNGGQAAITVGTSPIYLDGAGDITVVACGKADNSDSLEWARTRNAKTWVHGPAAPTQPVQKTITIANPGDGSWTNSNARDELYENNNYDVKRFPGKMSTRVTTDPERKGSFLAVHLEKQEKERKVMPFYTVIKPAAPVPIPGKATAMGMWVKANSDWGRIVYWVVDAKGERWLNCGKKDDWNNNDVHGWSAFNFDGWRYLRFELPGNADYDAFREYGSTWWGNYGGDGIVDLPLKLEKVIVERRTHVLYVNDIQPADPADVLLGEVVAEYETPFDATPAAVAQNAIRMPIAADGKLPNPIVGMAGNALAPVTLQGIRMPDWGYDGTSAHINFTETPDAAGYQVWVAAYPDGRGAVALGNMPKSGGLMYGLRPAMKLYLWVTYKTKDGQQSRPSNRLDIELVDAFSQK